MKSSDPNKVAAALRHASERMGLFGREKRSAPAMPNLEVLMLRGGLLWLLGIPLPIILLLWLFGFFH